MTEDEMVGWRHWLYGHEVEQAPRVAWTGKPGLLESMGSDMAESNRTEQLSGNKTS